MCAGVASSFQVVVKARRWKMQAATLVVLAALVAVAASVGQFYVPRAYYTIDSEGHPSIPVPLRRLRRSYNPNPYPTPGGGWGGAASGSNSWSQASSGSNSGSGWYQPPPPGSYGATAPGH